MVDSAMPLGRLWDRVKKLVNDNAQKYVYEYIPKERTDIVTDDVPLRPYDSYFRLWLSEMFLTKSVSWGAEWFPAVHSAVKLKFGDQDDVVFTRVARPPDNQLAQGVLLNYRLTELMPYNGGVIEIEASLLALKGDDYLGTAIGVLQEFSSLVTAPLGQVLSLADKVSTGARDLFDATNGAVHLPLHQSFTAPGDSGGTVFKPGYIAVILATRNQVAADRLSVQGDQLYYIEKEGDRPSQFQGYAYMLLRIEGRRDRDDWRLKNIDEPLRLAIVALSQGKSEEAAAYKTLALTTAWQSPDLAPLDRRRVVEAIKAELAEVEGTGLGAVGSEAGNLETIMSARAMPLAQAAALGPVLPSEVLRPGN